MALSPKQILAFNQATRRFNLWVGAVRSGKTYSSILKLIDLIKNGPEGDVMIIGVNRATIQRNVLQELYNFLGWPPPPSKNNAATMYGRHVYFVGAHDEGSVRAIQGSTLAIAYVDEATCIPAPFWKMLLSRLSKSGAQLLATCNPEGPAHWLKKEYIDREDDLDMISWHFNLDDNPSLDEAYKENLKKEYGHGMWYKRLILGEWCSATGAIYESFDEDNIYEHPFATPNYYIAGIDYGIVNATCCLLAGISPRQWPQIRIEKEYYYDSVKSGRCKSDAELADDIQKFLAIYPVRAIYLDPSAASLKVELRNRNLPVLDAKNDVIPGIQVVSKFLEGKNLVIHKDCINLREQLSSYVWDQKATDRGEDKPVKQFDHAPDSLRYLTFSAFPEGIFSHPSEDLTIEQLKRQVYGDESLLGPAMGGGGYI